MTKEYILFEIRRTAEENGGKPLGRGKFFTATGIKDKDWSGRYWARWGDAVREAGYEPNTLQESTPDEEILEKIAKVALDLGKFPTSAELRLRSKQGEKLPSHMTIRRLGVKRVLVQRVLDFCRSHEEFSPIISICELELSSKEKRLSEDTSPDHVEFGEVYLLKSGKYYKIGRSKDARVRHGQLKIQLPEPARFVHSIRTDDPSGIEAYWHHRFKGKRKGGEWFELCLDEVAAFKRRKTM